MDKTVFFSGEYILMLVKSVCRWPFLVAAYGEFILRGDGLLHYMEM